ncbi:MAG TPA: hypothetical protein VE155_07155 [Pseudonocardiaceae bacterium]|nr:hypothetical protein [Pseudonocardiaceae bacterium]
MNWLAVVVWALFSVLVLAYVAVAAFLAAFGLWWPVVPAAILVIWMVRDANRLHRR